MKLSARQEEILDLVEANAPMTGRELADALGLSKSTLRTDLAVLTMLGLLAARPRVGYFRTQLSGGTLVAQQLAKYSIHAIMSPPITVGLETSVHDAINDMFVYDTSSLYVLDDQQKNLEGVVSRKDLLRGLAAGMSTETAIAVLMTRVPNVQTIPEDGTAFEAVRLITHYRVDSLPVVKAHSQQHVVGKVSKTNLVDLMMTIAEQEE